MKLKQTLKIAGAIATYALAVLICEWLSLILPVTHWGFAISVNFFYMLYFTLLLGLLYKPRYTSGYFNSKPFERDGELYKWFGIHYYIAALRLIGWEKLQRKDQQIRPNLHSLKVFEHTTRGSEAVHTLAAVMVILTTIRLGFSYSSGEIKWLLVINILVNIYPALLQRYNRPRVIRAIRRKELGSLGDSYHSHNK